MTAFTHAWRLLKSRTERNYPAALQQGRAGTQTQHNPLNLESRMANPPGRVRSQAKQQAMAHILDSLKPNKNNVRDIDTADINMLNSPSEANEEETRMYRTPSGNTPTLAEDMAMAAMRAQGNR